MLAVLHKQFKALPSFKQTEKYPSMLKDRGDRNSHGAPLAELSLTETNDVYGFETGVQPATSTRIKTF